jgi:1,4-alpha-glucan branching enzyme
MKAEPKSESPTPGSKTVEVWCHAPGAHEVFLAGSFNDWNPKATPMTRHGENWHAKLSVVPGFYSYNFVIDGKWVCDPNRMEPHDVPCQLLITHWLG